MTRSPGLRGNYIPAAELTAEKPAPPTADELGRWYRRARLTPGAVRLRARVCADEPKVRSLAGPSGPVHGTIETEVSLCGKRSDRWSLDHGRAAVVTCGMCVRIMRNEDLEMEM